jgi:DNA repair protein SbcC/Rad50
MMIFSKFKDFKNLKKPDWQHPDPDVRRTAIDRIDDENILKQLIATDTDSVVRRFAIRKLSDLDVLYPISQQDNDPDIRECAQHRVTQLLITAKEAPVLADRLAWVRQNADTKLLEQLVLKAQASEIRLAAIEKIEREALLGDVASQDAVPALRLAAVEKIQQKSTLERVYKATRSSDKQVSRMAKEKLDRLLEQEQRPLKIQSDGEVICKRLELLGRGKAPWTQEQLEFSQLQQRWQAIAEEVQKPLSERYQQAESAFLAAWHDHETAQRQQQEQQQTLDSQRESKRDLCQHATATLEELTQLRDTPLPCDIADYFARLDTWQARWRELPILSDSKEEKQWQQRFEHSLTAIRRLLSQREKAAQLNQSLRKLCERAENALTRPVKSSKIKELKDAWHALGLSHTEEGLLREGALRFQTALRQLEEQLTQQAAQRDQWVEQLNTELQNLEHALEKGELHTAIDLEKNSVDLLNKITGLPAAQYKTLESRLHESVTKIREWRSWENWGVLNERKLLCEQAEQLLIHGADDPEKTAHTIRKMQEEWKKLGSISNSQGLWKRFNEACNKAYDSCQVYFDQQAQQRQANLQAKKQLCQSLEDFMAQINWEKPNWREMNQYLHSFKKEWHNIGATDRKDRKSLKECYDQLAGQLERKLNAEYVANKTFRERLIQDAEAAQTMEDTAAAIELTKSIQNRWKVTVPGQRKMEHHLWERFRKTCDVVFERSKQEKESRKAVEEQEKNARIQKLEYCTGLCEEVEQWLSLNGNDLVQALARLKEFQAKWREISTMYAAEAKALDKRFHAACHQVKLKAQLQLLTEEQMQLKGLAEKAALCHELEMATHKGMVTPEQIEMFQSRWSEYPALEKTAYNTLMQQRFEHAKLGIIPISPEARKARELLCVRLEILANVESPPEQSQLRLSLRMAQLSEALSGVALPKDKVAELQALEQEWYLTPPCGEEYAAVLEHRFSQTKAMLIHSMLYPPLPSKKDEQSKDAKKSGKATQQSDTK